MPHTTNAFVEAGSADLFGRAHCSAPNSSTAYTAIGEAILVGQAYIINHWVARHRGKLGRQPGGSDPRSQNGFPVPA